MLGGRAVRHAAMLGDLACARAHVHSTLACFAYAVHVWPVHPMQGGWPQVTRPFAKWVGKGGGASGVTSANPAQVKLVGACEEY